MQLVSAIVGYTAVPYNMKDWKTNCISEDIFFCWNSGLPFYCSLRGKMNNANTILQLRYIKKRIVNHVLSSNHFKIQQRVFIVTVIEHIWSSTKKFLKVKYSNMALLTFQHQQRQPDNYSNVSLGLRPISELS